MRKPFVTIATLAMTSHLAQAADWPLGPLSAAEAPAHRGIVLAAGMPPPMPAMTLPRGGGMPAMGGGMPAMGGGMPPTGGGMTGMGGGMPPTGGGMTTMGGGMAPMLGMPAMGGMRAAGADTGGWVDRTGLPIRRDARRKTAHVR